MTEFFLRVALRFRLLGSAAGIHLKAFDAQFDHRRRAPTEVTVRRVDDKSWQLVWAVQSAAAGLGARARGRIVRTLFLSMRTLHHTFIKNVPLGAYL